MPDNEQAPKKVKWYQRREIYGPIISLLSYSPEIINSLVATDLLPEHTLVAKLALPAGLILTALGLRRGIKDQNLTGMKNGNQLPEGVRSGIDKTKEIIQKFKN